MMADALNIFLLGLGMIGVLAALIATAVVVGAMLIVLTHQAMRWVDRRKP